MIDAGMNLGQLIESRVERSSEKIFLFAEPEGREFSYQQFDQLVNQTANLVAGLGVGKGDVVSLWLPNCVEFLLFYFACWKLGAVAGPINAQLKGPEASYIMNHSQARMLVTQGSTWPRLRRIRRGLRSIETVILTDGRAEGAIDFRSQLNRQSTSLGRPDVNPDDEAIIIYTSGTTGTPKGVLLTHGNLIANARQIADWLAFDEDDRFLCIMPLFHMNAVAVTTLTPLQVGASLVLSPKFSAGRHWQVISDYRVTTFGSVATMLSMLLNTYPDGVPPGLDTRCLKFAMCGSAPVPVPIMEAFQERFQCPVIEGYGLSESTCRATFNPVDQRRLGSVGLPIGNEMKIVDENDQELPPGQVGEIVLRGENLMKGYFRNSRATEEAFRGGWFHTGDVGYQDEDGFFYVVDRKSDMIIRGGENIYPREIDDVLYRHPAVKEAATVGVPDELYGEAVKAFVVLKADAHCSEDELLAFCHHQLADYKCPSSIEFLTEIPTGPTGKLLKRELNRRCLGDVEMGGSISSGHA